MNQNRGNEKNFINCTSFNDAIKNGEHMNEQYKCAMKMASIGLWEWLLETDDVLLSDEIFELTSLEQENFDGKITYIVGKLIHLEDRVKFMKSMALVRRQGIVRNLVYRINHRDKEECWVKFESQLIKDDEGKVIKLIGTIQEVTESYKEKIDTEHRLAFMESILESLPTPIYYKGVDGEYKYCNEALLKFMGQHRNKLIGKTVEGIIPNDLAQMYQYADESLLTNKESQMFEGKVPHKDGSYHTVLFSKAAHVSAQGKVQGIVGVMQDISNQKSIEREEQMLYKAKDVFDNQQKYDVLQK